MLNANGDPARFAGFGLPVVADSVAGFRRAAGRRAGRARLGGDDSPGITHVASFATDAPFLPRDLVPRLVAGARRRAPSPRLRRHRPARRIRSSALWPVDLRAELRHALVEEDIRKVDRWTARYALAVVDFPVGEVDPFFNTNRPEDLEAAEQLLAVLGAGA